MSICIKLTKHIYTFQKKCAQTTQRQNAFKDLCYMHLREKMQALKSALVSFLVRNAGTKNYNLGPLAGSKLMKLKQKAII